MTRTFGPEVSFVSSPKTEKERLLYVSASVASGFYPRHGFVILPRRIPGSDKHYTIVLPEVLKNVSQKYWTDAAKAGSTMPLHLTDRMWQETSNIQLDPVNNNIIQKIKGDWQKAEIPFFKILETIFPDEIKWIGSVEVRITKIGSLGSHYLLTKNKNQHLVINLREDADFSEIANLIILSLIYPLTSDIDLTFTKRQILRNFLMTRREIKRLFPDWKPQEYTEIKIPEELRQNSDDYLISLGVPKVVDPISIINKSLDIFGTKEEKLLRELIKNKNELISYDQIADIIWGEGKFKSYWAINKIVQRIQKKIDKIEVERIKIVGVRGRGYKLSLKGQAF